MRSRFSMLQARTLALAILAAIILLISSVVFLPLRAALEAQQDRIERSLKLLAAYQRAAAEREGLERDLKAINAAPATMAGLFDGASAPLTAAKVQSEIKRIVEMHGGEVTSAQNLPSSVTEGFQQIAIRYDIVLPMKAVGQVVYEIETHTPYLFIDGVDIRAPETSPLEQKPEQDPKLAIRWDIRAYRQTGSP